MPRRIPLTIIIGILVSFPRIMPGEDGSSPFRPAPLVARELEPGEMMPDVPLRGEDGRTLRLQDFRGKTVALTFFYSRCTAAALCPLVGRNFDATQAILQQMDASLKCHLLSISLDPQHDTAEMLSAYARGYSADPERWTFATGEDSDVRKLGEAVGLNYTRTGDRIDHNLRTVIVDANGRVRRIFRGDNWTPQELAAELNATARRYH